MSTSFVQGASMPPLLEMTLGQALERTIEAHGHRTALIVPGQDIRWTWSEFGSKVDALATGLLSLGLRRGERIGIWSPNRAEWVLAQLATARVGLVLVNINPAYRLAEVEYALNKVKCRAVIAAPSFKTSSYIEMLRKLGPSRLTSLEFMISLGKGYHDGFIPFDELCLQEDTEKVTAAQSLLSNGDAINIQFTSGTTGMPKGATLSHRNILNNGYFVGQQIGLTPEDILCIPVPLYHCFGMVMGNLACLMHGAAIVYPSEGFDAFAVLSAIQTERCTALYGVPTMFISMLEHPDFRKFDLSSLRTGIMAGSACPERTMRQVIEHMHMEEVTIAYGMTETSPVSFQTSRNDPVHERVTTVGKIQPHLEVKLIDGNGAIVPRGVPGELCTRGYSVMRGYWDEPERTKEAIDSEGWMRTGDLATLDDAGYCRITGRIKDMLIRGGENIYPREIEEFLMRHPEVSDVQVVGVPDEKYGEEVCACIILKDGSDTCQEDLREFCRKQIAHFKVPRHVLILSEFPMTVTGKVQKYLLRERALELLSGKAN